MIMTMMFELSIHGNQCSPATAAAAARAPPGPGSARLGLTPSVADSESTVGRPGAVVIP